MKVFASGAGRQRGFCSVFSWVSVWLVAASLAITAPSDHRPSRRPRSWRRTRAAPIDITERRSPRLRSPRAARRLSL